VTWGEAASRVECQRLLLLIAFLAALKKAGISL
jgi:hypothetical protein